MKRINKQLENDDTLRRKVLKLGYDLYSPSVPMPPQPLSLTGRCPCGLIGQWTQMVTMPCAESVRSAIQVQRIHEKGHSPPDQ